MTDYTDVLTRLDNKAELNLMLNKEASEAIQQLIEERDYYKEECLEQLIKGIEMNDKQFDGNWKAECLELRDEIAALKAERDAALVEFNQCSSVLDETERWVESLESEIITLKSALREAKNGLCNLDPVIQWLNNGCEVSEAVKELSVYEHLRCKTLATIDDALK